MFSRAGVSQLDNLCLLKTGRRATPYLFLSFHEPSLYIPAIKKIINPYKLTFSHSDNTQRSLTSGFDATVHGTPGSESQEPPFSTSWMLNPLLNRNLEASWGFDKGLWSSLPVLLSLFQGVNVLTLSE